jgi:hypothetical protein
MTIADQSSIAAAGLKRMTARHYEDAVAMPLGVRTSEEFQTRESDRMFRQDWACVDLASSLSRPGDPAFNIRWFPKEAGLAICNVRPSKAWLSGPAEELAWLCCDIFGIDPD